MKQTLKRGPRVALCRACRGTGRKAEGGGTCPQCLGSGRVTVSWETEMDIRPWRAEPSE